jgi:uncharacterized protein (DUF58 family)
MITPTRNAVLLFVATIPLSLVLLVNDAAGWWPLAVCASLSVLALIGLDLLLAPAARRFQVAVSAPPLIGIGDAAALRIAVAPLRHPAPLPLELTCDTSGPAAPSPSVHTVLVPGEPGELTLPLYPRRRGRISVDTLWLRWAGPLTLIRRSRQIPLQGVEVAVAPNVRRVHGEALRYLQRDAEYGLKSQLERGSGAEFDALREYQPGLDTRFIDWKHSARHRRLLCKEFRSERNHHVILAIDSGRLMSEPLGEIPRLDHAINAALLLGWVAARSGDLVGLFAFDSRVRQWQRPLRGSTGFTQLRQRSAAIAYQPEETNHTLGLAELDQRLNRRALIVLFTDFVDTISAELLVEHLQRVVRRHLVVFVTLRDPYLEQSLTAEPDSLTSVSRAVVSHEILRDRAVVLERLARLGVDCLEVEQGALSIALVNRYLAIKQGNRI